MDWRGRGYTPVHHAFQELPGKNSIFYLNSGIRSSAIALSLITNQHCFLKTLMASFYNIYSMHPARCYVKL